MRALDERIRGFTLALWAMVLTAVGVGLTLLDYYL